MTNRAEDLQAAAEAIDPISLQMAKAAVSASCEEYIRWTDLFTQRLQTLEFSGIHKFVRALALTMLGHLPARPETCPFCVQYEKNNNCQVCGYALTHGSCDCIDSSFSLFIEAFQELGRVIYQDTGEKLSMPKEAKAMICSWLESSKKIARKLKDDLVDASCLRFMEYKARYLSDMICTIPLEFFSEEVWQKSQRVRIALNDYW